MTCEEYIKAFTKFYRVDGFLDYRRSSGKNLYYKRLLIYILRTKFKLAYPLIGELLRNTHATVLYHFKIIETDPNIERMTEDAWTIYRD